MMIFVACYRKRRKTLLLMARLRANAMPGFSKPFATSQDAVSCLIRQSQFYSPLHSEVDSRNRKLWLQFGAHTANPERHRPPMLSYQSLSSRIFTERTWEMPNLPKPCLGVISDMIIPEKDGLFGLDTDGA
jgi:hypothetical protein